MSKGIIEGTAEEVYLVKLLNSNKEHPIWTTMGLKEAQNCYAIHVIRHAWSELLGRSIKPKSDVYITSGMVDFDYLLSKGYFLDENDIDILNLQKLDYSGISVKRVDSHSYQILKTSPSTFEDFFESPRELGAGVSIYCKNIAEIYKNEAVLRGWGVTDSSFIKYFSKHFVDASFMFDDSSPQKQIITANKIKTFSINQLHDIITSNQEISGRVFYGAGLYDEPYVAHWLFEKGEFRKNCEMPFTVTTGSGRSRGDFTVVIKPRK